ncbi:unnamed protein product [Adineta steineri]|uniref:Uncharacterized protein n=1 Tax=Adineta steineri TaxID=433720 RepID=A0A815XCH8_9BILA|nr:unnamed protein product [Adineta steineri]CAF1555707.1 unnamed protein product [Adineta steineri]
MEQEILYLVNKQLQQAFSNALTCLTQTSSLDRSFQSNILVRCRSLSNHRKVSSHNTNSHCSLPITTKDFIYYETIPNLNRSRSNKTVNVQYSFSLNQPLLTKLNEQQQNLINIQSYVDELIHHSMRTVLLQINNQVSMNEDDTSYSAETFEVIDSYIDEFIHYIIEQTIELITSSDIEHISNQIVENIINSALSTIANDNENNYRKINENSLPLEDNKQSIDYFLNDIAQRIYTDSFNQLKQ